MHAYLALDIAICLPQRWSVERVCAAKTGFLACIAVYLGLVVYFAIGPQRCAWQHSSVWPCS